MKKNSKNEKKIPFFANRETKTVVYSENNSILATKSTREARTTNEQNRRLKKPETGRTSSQKDNSKTIKIEKFKIDLVRTLGEGSYAKVCTATHTETGHVYACKIIDENKEMGNFVEKFLPRELKLMRKFNSPRVTCVHGIFKTHNLYYILMDYCENGDLLRYLQRKARALEEDEVKEKTLQIFMGIKYLHEEAQVSHRDLKCENILIDGNNNLKLADFGFARSCVPFLETTEADQKEMRIIRDFMDSDVATLPVLHRLSTSESGQDSTTAAATAGRSPQSNSRMPIFAANLNQARSRTPVSDANPNQPVTSTTFCGSVAYAAPEVLSRKSYDPKKYDMWSAGVIVFIMACFFMPFDDSDQAKMVRRQMAKKWRYPPDLQLSDSLKEFLEALMEPSPKDRLSVGEALKHKWLKQICHEILENRN